jgi:hypothetical protein
LAALGEFKIGTVVAAVLKNNADASFELHFWTKNKGE